MIADAATDDAAGNRAGCVAVSERADGQPQRSLIIGEMMRGAPECQRDGVVRGDARPVSQGVYDLFDGRVGVHRGSVKKTGAHLGVRRAIGDCGDEVLAREAVLDACEGSRNRNGNGTGGSFAV